LVKVKIIDRFISASNFVHCPDDWLWACYCF